MKAAVYRGTKNIVVEEVDKPKIQDPRDAILKVTTAGLCGSDLHMYEGRTDLKEGTILGHEIMGVIDEVGPGVNSIKVGDRVVLPFNIACGYCFNCVRGYTSACLTMNPDNPTAGYGYADMGPYAGGQAQYVRVPNVDYNALKVPGKPFDEFEDDFLLLSDVFPTGYFSTELAKVQPGSMVVIFGAGPVGLMALLSSEVKGASRVYVVDAVESRLSLVKKLGGVPIDFSQGSPVEQIQNDLMSNPMIMGKNRPGEEKSNKILCGIDAVGWQAKDFKDSSKENPSAVLNALIEIIAPTGHIGDVGVYEPYDPKPVDENAGKGMFLLSYGKLFFKGLTLGAGQTPVKKFDLFLRDVIIGGKAKPSQIVSHHISLDDLPDAYDKFDRRVEEYTKVLINPNGRDF